jgi:hypothetical protein
MDGRSILVKETHLGFKFKVHGNPKSFEIVQRQWTVAEYGFKTIQTSHNAATSDQGKSSEPVSLMRW